MEMGDVIKYIYNNLGLNNNFIFTSTKPQDIQKYIEDNTIKTYSQYYHYDVEYTGLYLSQPINGSEFDSQHGIYLLPNEVRNGLKIFSVGQVKVDTHMRSYNPYMGDEFPTSPFYQTFEDVALNVAAIGNGIPTIYAKYEAPDRVVIRNYYKQDLSNTRFNMRVSYIHAKNLNTIQEGHSESFKQLALYDIMILLYENEFKFIDGAALGNAGNVDLKIERFRTAVEDRKTLLEQWASKAALNKGYAMYT